MQWHAGELDLILGSLSPLCTGTTLNIGGWVSGTGRNLDTGLNGRSGHEVGCVCCPTKVRLSE